ncbi:serine hydrolase domain-containing protein [Polymorphobacter fuscus]|uniref:Serine hydrolase n=1 Tax=Sandarakinorhabdus fusca TaxID=1439888 RepID=A0A7C9GMY2_9SPHN|nr:serine hydrolase domain-containing protein [Polymorphobacter fuscus]KAB7648782.1 beta-lactamase family protein [Polymorphobacter fuscus]MQT16357.1 serine hydrolase [Polymorphobacter fuscus]NJC07355.1 CubicO group peptidase (beta-lactamase class C family) [Polymorphobacter fuscus]
MADDLGFSAERLDRIDRFLADKYVTPGKLAGTLTMVARHGDIAHLGLTGHADRERGTAMAEDTIFRIYSMTKPVTSVALLMLVEEGKIALDDPVHRYIPEWRNLAVYAAGTHRTGFQTTPVKRPMQVVDLLRHTSGLTYGFQLRSNVDAAYRAHKIGEIEKAGTLADMIAALGRMPLEFSPGDAWNYSVATDVCGWLVEVVSGQTFEDFLRDRLFTPLGMVDTGFHVRDGQAHRFATCYQPTRDGGIEVQDDAATSSFLSPPAFVSGGGGLVSTAHDYLRFCTMLLNGGTLDGKRYISRKTLDLMTANHLPGGASIAALSRSLFSEAAYDGVGFGLGFATTIDAARTLMPGSDGDYFWGGAASTFFWIDPQEDLVGIFMTQLIPSSTYPVRRELRTMVYAALDD